MAEAIRFRRATAADVGELTRLYRHIGTGANTSDVAEETVARTFERVESLPGYGVFLALAGERIVGTFLLVIVQTLGSRCAPEAVVEDVVVDPDTRGEGIGRRMIEFAMNEAARAGCYKLVLSSNLERVEAHAFYERLGFRRHGYSFMVDLSWGDSVD